MVRPRYVLDTNVLLRFLLGDVPDQGQAAARLFALADAGRVSLFLPFAVVCETVFTLERHYKRQPEEVADVLTRLLDHDAIQVQDEAEVRLAVAHHRRGFGFGDACVLAAAARAGADAVVSFDQRMARLEDSVLHPSAVQPPAAR